MPKKKYTTAKKKHRCYLCTYPIYPNQKYYMHTIYWRIDKSIKFRHCMKCHCLVKDKEFELAINKDFKEYPLWYIKTLMEEHRTGSHEVLCQKLWIDFNLMEKIEMSVSHIKEFKRIAKSLHERVYVPRWSIDRLIKAAFRNG